MNRKIKISLSMYSLPFTILFVALPLIPKFPNSSSLEAQAQTIHGAHRFAIPGKSHVRNVTLHQTSSPHANHDAAPSFTPENIIFPSRQLSAETEKTGGWRSYPPAAATSRKCTLLWTRQLKVFPTTLNQKNSIEMLFRSLYR